MKKNYSGNSYLLLLVALLLFSCGDKKTNHTETVAHTHGEQAQYTCPMHPQIVRDRPGKCPICGMDLVPMSSSNELHLDSSLLPLLKPVNEQVISGISTIKPESGSRIFSAPIEGIVVYDTRKQESIASRVTGRIERMYIKYNYQPVRKGQLIMEIYSPDLAAAQRELIYLSKSENDALLFERAKQRLSLLGMQPAQISQVVQSGKPLYRVPVYSTVGGYIVEKNIAVNPGSAGTSLPPSGSSSAAGMGGMESGASGSNITATQQAINPSPVLTREGQYVSAGETVFTIYKDNSLVAEFSFAPALAAELKPGQKLLYHAIGHSNDIKTGSIDLIEPKQKNGENFTVAKVYMQNADLKPGQLLAARIPVVKNSAYWLPQEAVLQLGINAVVFKKENNVFVPKQVQTGIKVDGRVEIKDAIDNWEVAKNAGFLVDSESFIRLNSTHSK